MVNHDAPHQLRGCRDKVAPALPDRLRIIDQPQIGFVENGGGLQGMAGALPAHVMVGEPVQFRLHQREQLLERSLVSAAPVAEELSDLLARGWGRRHTACSTPQILTRSRIFYSTAGGDQKKLRSRGGFQAAFPLYHMNRHKQQKPEKPKQKANLKQEKHMQTKHSVTNNHQPSTACREKHAAMKLPIRSTVIAAFGLLSMLLLVHQAADAQGNPPRSEAAHAQHLSPSRFDLVPASDAIASCLPNAAATVAVFAREDVRGVDTLDLHAEGLRPNTTFAVFLTEMPVPPFGAVQYIGDFTTNAAGTGSVRVDAIVDEAFAFNNITGVRTDLNHIVFWFADPDDDEDCVPGSAPGHFDGDDESGVAAMSSKNFLPGAPLP